MKHKLNILFLSLSWLVAAFFIHDDQWRWVVAISASLLFFIILSVGVLHFPFNYFMTATHRVDHEYILLSFDDGPDEQFTPRILDTLKQHNIAALFFVIGSKAEKHPELIRRMLNEGHLVGNHTYTHHPLFAMFSERKVEQEIVRGQHVITELIGDKPTFFRPPIGYTNPKIARVVERLKVKPIGWTLRSFDTLIKDPVKLRNRMIKHTRPGKIVLLHDNLPQTAEMLPEFIAGVMKENRKFVDPVQLKHWQL
jgi:peptidoglycan/xylan/chitin deacetylase (PgdA/CDA1 family)